MAILGVFEAEIIVDGEALQEFSDHDDPRENPLPRTVRKYVKVPTKAEFSVRVSLLDWRRAPPEDLMIGLQIDGGMSLQSLMRPMKDAHVLHLDGRKVHGENNGTDIQPLLFNSIDFGEWGWSCPFRCSSANDGLVEATQEASSGSLSIQKWQDIGTMKVTVYKVTNVRESTHRQLKLEPGPVVTGNSRLQTSGITQCVMSVIMLPERDDIE